MIDGRRPPATIDTGVSGRGWSRHAHAAILSDAGMLTDADVAEAVGVGAHQVAELVARGRLEMVDHEHRCAVASAAQLLRRDGAAIDHAMGCELCTATRAALREGRRQLREVFAAPARRPVARRGARAERIRSTARGSAARRLPPPPAGEGPAAAPDDRGRAATADPGPGPAGNPLVVAIDDLSVGVGTPHGGHGEPAPAPPPVAASSRTIPGDGTAATEALATAEAPVTAEAPATADTGDPRGRRARTVGMLGVLVLAMGTMTPPAANGKVPLPAAMSHRPEPAETMVSADDPVWERLAGCESSGRWDLDTGNGFYGGLQFTRSSWEMVGGQGLPHEASREEQVQRAVALHDVQGWGAWPGCAEKLGLSGG